MLWKSLVGSAASRRIGTVIDTARAPALSPQEMQYLASTNRALSLAALGAAGRSKCKVILDAGLSSRC